MAITSENNRALNQDEHNEDAHAKRVIIRGQNPTDGNFYNIGVTDNGDGTFSLKTSSSGSGGKATDAYAISNIEDTGTYKYFGFEDAGGAWYIMRKTISTSTFEYVKGASNYSTAWTNRASQSYGSYGSTF